MGEIIVFIIHDFFLVFFLFDALPKKYCLMMIISKIIMTKKTEPELVPFPPLVKCGLLSNCY